MNMIGLLGAKKRYKLNRQIRLFGRTRSISLLFFVHRHLAAANEILINAVKSLRKHVLALRNGRPACG